MINQQQYQILELVESLDVPTSTKMAIESRFGKRSIIKQVRRLRKEQYIYIRGHEESNGAPRVYGLTSKGYKALQAVEA